MMYGLEHMVQVHLGSVQIQKTKVPAPGARFKGTVRNLLINHVCFEHNMQ